MNRENYKFTASSQCRYYSMHTVDVLDTQQHDSVRGIALQEKRINASVSNARGYIDR